MELSEVLARVLVRRKAEERFGVPFVRERGPHRSRLVARDGSRRIIVRWYNKERPNLLGRFTVTAQLLELMPPITEADLVCIGGATLISIWLPLRWVRRHWGGREQSVIRRDGARFYWGASAEAPIAAEWVVPLAPPPAVGRALTAR